MDTFTTLGISNAVIFSLRSAYTKTPEVGGTECIIDVSLAH